MKLVFDCWYRATGSVYGQQAWDRGYRQVIAEIDSQCSRFKINFDLMMSLMMGSRYRNLFNIGLNYHAGYDSYAQIKESKLVLKASARKGHLFLMGFSWQLDVSGQPNILQKPNYVPSHIDLPPLKPVSS
ncbi:5'-3' exonuclease family protein [Striga asiatica]|uniref:5'-3' exonuclease family protein n=1 Tax=Striga asiatica TaxID=4170 RepID=A0A5A7QU61_STRAF|nr:5'-3' exonuclease family protein [Striga asiatica]